MLKFNRVLTAGFFLLTILCAALPARADTNTLTPDSGSWTVRINAEKAKVAIAAKEKPYSGVEVTVNYTNLLSLAKQSSSSPVYLIPPAKAQVTYGLEGFRVQSITFECTYGKVEIEASADLNSGGSSGSSSW